MSAATVSETLGAVGTSRLHTSEPRWPQEPPALDPSAGAVIVVAGPDEGAQAVAGDWAAAGARTGVTVRRVDAEPDAIAAALDAATAATRLMAAGDECVLALATSAAERSGWSRGEVSAVLTDPAGPRPVQCVHCKTVTATTAQIDETTACAGCGVPLLLFPHYSRRIGAYLGFRADAEELPE